MWPRMPARISAVGVFPEPPLGLVTTMLTARGQVARRIVSIAARCASSAGSGVTFSRPPVARASRPRHPQWAYRGLAGGVIETVVAAAAGALRPVAGVFAELGLGLLTASPPVAYPLSPDRERSCNITSDSTFLGGGGPPGSTTATKERRI